MSTSFCQVIIHIVFSTKERNQWLQKELEDKMHSYIAGIITNLKGRPLMINGTTDHIHILCLLPKDLSVADFVRTIKSNSSKWFREKHKKVFNWQEGYGAFSVGLSSVSRVKQYIMNQKEHHKRNTFDEEFTSFITEQLRLIK